MAGRDPQEKAKSSDREAALDLVERAHAEGRIGSADRTIRKNNIATAATLGELEMITRDLMAELTGPLVAEPAASGYDEPAVAAYDQPMTVHDQPMAVQPVASAGQDASAADDHPAAAAYDRAASSSYQLPPQAYMSRRVVVGTRSGAPVLLALVAALIGVAIAGSVFLTTVGLPDVEIGQPDPPVLVNDEYDLDEEGFRWVLGRYRREFGSTMAQRTVFYDSYVIFDVPSEDGELHTTWIYRDGDFTEMTAAQVTSADDVALDLKRVDFGALARNLQRAPGRLGVPDGTISHVIVAAGDPFEGQPTVSIYVSNTVGASGFMKTDLRGRALRTFPYGG